MEYKFKNNKLQCTYFYKENNTQVKFSISTNDRTKWTSFCQNLGRIATKLDFQNFIEQNKINYTTL